MALFDPKKNQISQLQKMIEDKNIQIGVYYDEIGKLYFRQYRDMNADVSREINTRCENIAALYVQIEVCRQRILYERGIKECRKCKKENLLEHAYCCACGEKFPDTNDISVVTAVDPDKFVIRLPEVAQITAVPAEPQMPAMPADPQIPSDPQFAGEAVAPVNAPVDAAVVSGAAEVANAADDVGAANVEAAASAAADSAMAAADAAAEAVEVLEPAAD